jgi:hypothetical protein
VLPEQAANVSARLTEGVRAAGGQINRLEEIVPLLEDVFIALAEERS